MAHFAQLDENNLVTQVIVIHNNELLDENGNETEAKGIAFCQSLFGPNGRWVQTSYNNNFRKRYAGNGFTYDAQRDAFIPPSPYPSWVLDETELAYVAPVPLPADAISMDNPNGKRYTWDESTVSWKEFVIPEA